MDYGRELWFLRKTLEKGRVQTVLLNPEETPDEMLDFGLRKFLGHEEELDQNVKDTLLWLKEKTVYRLTDQYFCKYMFLLLPETEQKRVLMVGPYMSFEMQRKQAMEMAEALGIPAHQLLQLERYYMHVPVVVDESPLFSMINVFAEFLWGEGNEYEIIDLNQDNAAAPHVQGFESGKDAKEDLLFQMKIMESRYEYENKLMELVSKGLTHRAEQMIMHAWERFFEQRIADPVRSVKNYCIICNTLMRKAAEQGGVHPIHLDRISSEYAKRIETVTGAEKGQKLMTEMVRDYCRMVRKSSVKKYSPQVRKAVTYIESDLSGELSLKTIAAAQNINASYLSDLFHRETGKTVTEYVKEKRAELGARLLTTTGLQIQTVAQYCGMADANYFSRVFKKIYGITPGAYREKGGVVVKKA